MQLTDADPSEYRTDPSAQPGNLLPALAALLLDLASSDSDETQPDQGWPTVAESRLRAG